MDGRGTFGEGAGMDRRVDVEPPLIVVVDDDDGMRRALQRLLAAAGFRARVFDSAEALRDSGCAATAHALVLDMWLPGESGADYYTSLPNPRPPAIFITAHDEPASRRTAQRAGACAYLVKPFDGADLLDSFASATWRNCA